MNQAPSNNNAPDEVRALVRLVARPSRVISVSGGQEMGSRLERQFDRYAEDLARFAPGLQGQFGCPTCLAAIQRSLPLREVVAEEHVRPRRLGGRITTLTCRRCNNDAGSQLEAHLVQRVLLEARKRPAKTTVRIRDAMVRAEMILPETSRDPHDIVVVKKRSDDRQIRAAQTLLKTGKHPIHLGLNFGYVELRTLVALLRAAYLFMFRTFGYRYVLDRSAAVVRDQLREPGRETALLKGIVWRLGADAPVGNAIAVLTQPLELSSFLVFLQLDEDPRHIAAVTLPPPGSDGRDLYERIRSTPRSTSIRARPIPPADGFIPFAKVWQTMSSVSAT